MTHDHLSIQDMMFILAEDRIDDLRASAPAMTDRTDRTSPAHDASVSSGIVARTVDAIGRRLITLGGSVVADDAIRQRALQR